MPLPTAFGNRERVLREDGKVRVVPGLAWRESLCPVDPGELDEALARRGKQKVGTVGHGRAALVKALDLWQMRVNHLKNVCPDCTIRPRYD